MHHDDIGGISARFFFHASASLSALLLAGTAYAQDGTSPITDDVVAAQTQEDRAQVGGELVVTARRREERLQDVPLAITAITAEALGKADIRDTVDVANFTPGLQFSDFEFGRNDRGGARALTFRGLTLANGSGVTAGALVFLDGAPVVGGEIPVGADIARVEVMRGPQNVYFGRSTLSGAVNYVTKDIGNKFAGQFEVKVAQFDAVDVEGSLTIPIISDVFGIRVTGRQQQNGGKYTNDFNNQKELGERKTGSYSITAELKPWAGFKAKGYFNYYESDDGPSATGMIPASLNNCNVGGTRNYFCGALPGPDEYPLWQRTDISPAVANQLFLSPINGGPSLYGSNFRAAFGQQRDQKNMHLIMSQDIGDFASISTLTAYHDDRYLGSSDNIQRDTVGATGFTRFQSSFGYHTTDFSQELRLSSAGNRRIRWTMGGNYVNTSRDAQTRTYTEAASGVVTASPPTGYSDSRAETKGVFGGLYIDVIKPLTVSLEARYQEDKRTDSSYAFPTTVVNGVTTIVPNSDLVRNALSKTFKSFSPRISVDYKINPDLTVYLSYATGVRPGGFNRNLLGARQEILDAVQQVAGLSNIPYDEEKIKVGELGLKGSFFDRAVFINLDVYYGNLVNQQIATSVPFSYTENRLVNGVVTPTLVSNSISVTSNIGKTEFYGIEFDGSWKVNDILSLAATGSWSPTNIQKYQCQACVPYIGTSDVTGNRLAQAPEWSSSISGDVRVPIPNTDWLGYFHADYVYRGSIFADVTNVTGLGDRHLVNLRAGGEYKGFAVEGFVTNLLNDLTYTGVNVGNDLTQAATSPTYYTVFRVGLPDPRTFGARLRYRF